MVKVTKADIQRARKKLGISPLSKTIKKFKGIKFAGKTKSFFEGLKKDDRKLNLSIKKSLSKKK